MEWMGNCIKCGGRLYVYPEGICNCDCSCEDKTPCPIHSPYQYEQFEQEQKVMLKIRFDVEFDKTGKIIQIYRHCDIPRPTCDGCRFEEWCDRVMDKLKELVKEEGIENV